MVLVAAVASCQKTTTRTVEGRETNSPLEALDDDLLDMHLVNSGSARHVHAKQSVARNLGLDASYAGQTCSCAIADVLPKAARGDESEVLVLQRCPSSHSDCRIQLKQHRRLG